MRSFDDLDRIFAEEKCALRWRHGDIFSWPAAAACAAAHTSCKAPTRADVNQNALCRFDAVIHFAGRKAVGESVDFPMLYYTHNVVGAVNLVEVMRKHNVKNVRPCEPGGDPAQEQAESLLIQ